MIGQQYLLRRCKTKRCSLPMPVTVMERFWDGYEERVLVRFRNDDRKYYEHPSRNIFDSRWAAEKAIKQGFKP